MNFLLFNIVLFIISYSIDYIALDWFNVEPWSKEFMQYYLFVNIPISALLTVVIVNKIKSTFNS